jgi:hypothetical protein
VVTLTERALAALRASLEAARRFDPDPVLRVVRRDGGVHAIFVEQLDPLDERVDVGGSTIGVESAIDGTIDAGEHNELIEAAP